MELIAHLVPWLPAREAIMPLLAILGEGAGIDSIAFAEDAEGADEGFDLASIRPMYDTPGDDQRIEQDGFVAARRFADHQARGIEAVGKVGQRPRLVTQACRKPGPA